MDPFRTPATVAMAAALLCLGEASGLAAQEEGEERARVKVSGNVVDDRSRDPVKGSRVVLAPLPSRTPRLGPRATDAAGRFAFDEVTPGRYLLTVRAADYGEMTDTVEVLPTEDLQLVIPLSTGSRSLSARVVRAQAPSTLRGFEERRRSGRGFVLTREQIESSNAAHLTDLLAQMPGVRVVFTPPAGNTLLLRAGCRPGVWVDGGRMRDAPPLDRIASTHSVAAIEVYHGLDLPAQFGVDACGGILIWTRTGSARSGELGDPTTGDLILRTAAAVALVVLTIFLTR